MHQKHIQTIELLTYDQWSFFVKDNSLFTPKAKTGLLPR